MPFHWDASCNFFPVLFPWLRCCAIRRSKTPRVCKLAFSFLAVGG